MSLAQALELGFSKHDLYRRRERGSFEPLSPNVIRLSGVPTSNLQLALAAVLDVPVTAALSHSTAAALWRVPGFGFRPLHVTRLRGGRNFAGQVATVHQPRALRPNDVTTLFRIPVVRPARLLLDIAGSYPYAVLERATDYVLTRRLAKAVDLHELVAALGRRGRPGIGALRELLATRPRDYQPPESNLELRFEKLCAEIGILGELERQVEFADEAGFIGRVDYLRRKTREIYEIDSIIEHGGDVDAAHDELRDARLEAIGYRVRRFKETDVFHRPRKVKAVLCQTR